QIFVDDGTRAGTKSHRCRTRANRLLPKLVSLEIEGESTSLAKQHVDALAVRRGRAGSVAVAIDHGVGGVFVGGSFDSLLPEDCTGLLIDADKNPLEVSGAPCVAGQENLSASRDRGGSSRSGKRPAPHDVLGGAPVDRGAVVVADGGPIWSAK